MNPLFRVKKDPGLVPVFRTIGFIGDSLSSGEMESYSKETDTKGYHDYYEYSWGQYIARKCGLTALNFSRGGLTCKSFLKDYIFSGNNPFLEEHKCQGYVIALGVNDVNHLDGYEEGLGSLSDIDFNNEDNSKDSFIGWYGRVIIKLRKLEPKCRIFLLTIPKSTRNKKDPSEVKKEQASNLIRKLSEQFDFCYVVDLRKNGKIYDKKFDKKYKLGGHLSPRGYMYTSDVVTTYMDYIIRHNWDDFVQVPFIGKGVHNDLHKW